MDDKLTVHFISALSTGGAERMLCRLICNRGPKSIVVFLFRTGYSASVLTSYQIPVFNLFHGLRYLLFLRFFTSTKLVLVAWMYHSCAITAFLSLLLGIPTSWNIRHSLYGLSYEKVHTALAIIVCKFLSFIPTSISFNSHTSYLQHTNFGFSSSYSQVLPNGFDFSSLDHLHRHKRSEFSSTTIPTIGVLARYHPMKNYLGFIRALSQIKHKKFHVLLCGAGVNSDNKELVTLISNLGLSDQVDLCGFSPNPNDFFQQIDILALPSLWGESFPNVLLESLAHKVLPVSTPIGDAPRIIKSYGIVSNDCSDASIATALVKSFDLLPVWNESFSSLAYQYAYSSYHLDSVSMRYYELW